MDTTFNTYQLLSRNLTRSLELKQAEPLNARETQYYTDHIGDVKSIDDFMKDSRLYNYAMKAFGLEDMAYAKAYIRKVLEEGVTDPDSFANKLTDKRFLTLAETFDFAQYGDTTTSRDAVKQPVVDNYVRQALETDEGEQNDGVQLALYFQRVAPTVASAYGLLGDPALWKVVQTTFGLPASLGSIDIDQQARIVGKALDVQDLQDPDKLAKLIQRFTVMWDMTQNPAPSPLLQLFQGSSYGATSLDASMTILNLRYGG